ncbi:MAG TPA: hypothetical protein VF542_01815, partial [Jatrophihabitans sp.]
MAATPGTKARQPASKKASGPGRARTGGSGPAGRARPASRTTRTSRRPPLGQRPVPAALGRLMIQ